MVRCKFGGSIIKSAGYDALRALLEIEFVSDGQVLQYSGVPEDVWYRLKCESRPDCFFQRAIKGCYMENRVLAAQN